MEVILKKDIKGLGYKNDVVTVKPGYGRNFLIPKGVALIATESNKRMIAENVIQMAHKAEKQKADAELLAQNIGNTVVVITTKAGGSGKIFGSITALQVSEALKAKGFEVDRKMVSFIEHPKQVGEYIVNLELHKAVKHDLRISIVAE